VKSSIGKFALRFAAAVVLFAPAVAAQAQGTGRTICRDVWVLGASVRWGPMSEDTLIGSATAFTIRQHHRPRQNLQSRTQRAARPP
jgi:hypothetical protein